MFWFRHEQVQWLSPQMPQIRLVMKWASRGSLPRKNTLYPRKMDEVARHSTTRRLSKSIFVWIPRLPTIRVTGSHDISTSFFSDAVSLMMAILSLGSGAALFRSAARGRGLSPRWLAVERRLGELAERAHRPPVH